MRNFFNLFIIFSLWLSTARCGINKLLEKGEKYIKEGNYHSAIAILSELYRKEGWDEVVAKAALRLGECYLRLKDYEGAQRLFEEAMIWGGQIKEEAELGVALCKLGEERYEEAMEILSDLLSKSDSREIIAYSYYYRGVVLERKSFINKAISDFREAREKAKGDKGLLSLIEEELRRCHNFYEGFQAEINAYLDSLEEARGMGDFDGCADILRKVARLYEDWGEMSRAIEFERKALEYSPSEEFSAGSWMNIAWRYFKEGKLKQAVEAFGRVESEYPYTIYAPEALLREGDVYCLMGETEKAAICYQTFLKRFPQDKRAPTVMINLVFALRGKEKSEEIEHLLEMISKRFANSEIGYFAIGYLHEIKGEYQKGLENYKKCAQYRGNYRPLALFGEGICLRWLGELEKSKEKLLEALETFTSLLEEYRESLPDNLWASVVGNIISLCLSPKVMDRETGYSQLWRVKELLLCKKPERLLTPELAASLYIALSRCYLQLGEHRKAVNCWFKIYSLANAPLFVKEISLILLTKFAPVILRAPSPVEKKSMEKSLFLSLDSAFSPKQGVFPDIYFIYPSNCSEAQRKLYENNLNLLVSSPFRLRSYIPAEKFHIVMDRDVKEEDLRKANLVLLGSRYENTIILKMQPFLPIKISEESIEIKGRRYEGRDICLIMAIPNPFNMERVALLVWSASPDSFIKEVRIPTYLPFTYIVSRGDFSDFEEEKILEAGFFLETPNHIHVPF
ncbi:MAG: tetratricopeptide repeat protein [bacterium]